MKHARGLTAIVIALWFSVPAGTSLATPGDKAKQPTLVPRSNAKPLTGHAKRGLDWLVKHQLPSGGWGQGDEAHNMGRSAGRLKSSANVADTCVAALALVRSGSTPSEGPYRKSLAKAVDYVAGQIEASDDTSLSITKIRGTRVQSKIGTYVDTFTAALFLTEVRGKMGDAKANIRVGSALGKTLRKIEFNQKEDGSWGNRGWATTLTQGMAAIGLNRAAQSGVGVELQALERIESFADKQYNTKSGALLGAGRGSAGVILYQAAATLVAKSQSVRTRRQNQPKWRKLATNKDKKTAAYARKQLAKARQSAAESRRLTKSMATMLDDTSVIRGFGSNGGEEFLSYLLASEALLSDNSTQWKKWDSKISKLIKGVQNGDGSWTGHHCITGRTFCTAAALLVLMADRAPVVVLV